MMRGMSRSKLNWYLVSASLVALPLVIACGSSPARPPVSASDKADPADSGGDDAKGDMATNPDDEDKKSGSDKASATDDKSEKKADSKKSSDKKADDDDDDDKAPKDDSRTTASVANIFKENRKAFKKCYEDVRKEQPELKGNVLLKVVLDGEGKVKKAFVDDESSIHNNKITDCMIKLAKGLTYPKSSKGLDKDFEYDFGFNNQSK
jgi:hypothetical protein